MTEPVKTLSRHAATLIAAANLAVVLWMGATLQELDKTMPLIIYRIDILEMVQKELLEAQSSENSFRTI